MTLFSYYPVYARARAYGDNLERVSEVSEIAENYHFIFLEV